jgi:chlorophyllide a reductase subunit Z
VTQDFFGTASFRDRRDRNLRARGPKFPRKGHGTSHAQFAFSRRAGVKPDNAAVRDAIREKPPLILFGSYNERMYIAECRRARDLHAGVVPGSAIIRRHTGTPFMGYAGATYLVQEVCNALFDALFNILPLAGRSRPGRGDAGALPCGEMPWSDEAKALLDEVHRGSSGPGQHIRRQAAARCRRARRVGRRGDGLTACVWRFYG